MHIYSGLVPMDDGHRVIQVYATGATGQHQLSANTFMLSSQLLSTPLTSPKWILYASAMSSFAASFSPCLQTLTQSPLALQVIFHISLPSRCLRTSVLSMMTFYTKFIGRSSNTFHDGNIRRPLPASFVSANKSIEDRPILKAHIPGTEPPRKTIPSRGKTEEPARESLLHGIEPREFAQITRRVRLHTKVIKTHSEMMQA